MRHCCLSSSPLTLALLLLLLGLDQSLSDLWNNHSHHHLEFIHSFQEKAHLSSPNEFCRSSTLQGYRFSSALKNSEAINYVGVVNQKPVLVTLISHAHDEQVSEMIEIDWYKKSCSRLGSSVRGSQTMQRKFRELFQEPLEKNQPVSIETMESNSRGLLEIYSFSRLLPSFLSPWTLRIYPPDNQTAIKHTFTFQKSTKYLISEQIIYTTQFPSDYKPCGLPRTASIVVNISIEYDSFTVHNPELWPDHVFLIECPFTQEGSPSPTAPSSSTSNLFSSPDNYSALPTRPISSLFLSPENYKLSLIITACLVGLILAYIVAIFSD